MLGLDRSAFHLCGTVRLSQAQSAHLASWRGWSAIAVTANHAVHIFGSRSSPFWASVGGAAVMVFFVLSGFFIHKSLARSFSQGRPADFIAARADRILPPFIFALLFTIALWTLAPLAFGGDRSIDSLVRSEFSIAGLTSTAFFLNGFVGTNLSANGPLWSLSYEIWYYVLAFLMTLAVVGRRLGWLFVPALATLTILEPGFLLLGTVWVLGFAVSVLHSNDRLPRLPHWPFGALALLFWGAYLLTPSETRLPAFDIAIGAWFAAFLAQVVQREPQAFAPFTARFSYTLYVIHFPLLLFACGSGVPGWLAFPAVLAIGALVGPIVESMKIIPRDLMNKGGVAGQP